MSHPEIQEKKNESYTQELKRRLEVIGYPGLMEYLSEDGYQFHLPDYRLGRLLSLIEEKLPVEGQIVISLKTLDNAIFFADKTYHNSTVADPEWIKCLKYKLFGPNWKDLEEKNDDSVVR